MSSTTALKLGFAIVLLLAALAAGVYLSGLIIVLVLGVDVPVEMNTWWKYWRIVETPRVAPFASKIKISSAIGFGLPLLGWLALLVPLLRTRQPSTHGNARFAHKSELAKGGMLKPAGNGIVVGKAGNDLIRLGGTRHALLSAPTRSGKGVGAVIPNLLTFEESLMVLDIKQEAFDLTSGWRSQYGPVYLFNPFAEDLRTHRWNPLTYVSNDPKFRITDLQAIAAILYEDDPQRDSFWTNQARNCFLAASLYLCETDADRAAQGFPADQRPVPSLGRIYRLFSGDGGDLKAYLKELASRAHLSKDCRTAFSNLTSLADQTFTSVIGSFQEPLHIFLNPILDAATSGDDFDLRNLRRQKMTVYVGITPNKLAEARKLLNLFFSQAININTQQLPEKDPGLKYQCLLLLDEFTSIGKVDIIAHAISYLAGYNMRVFCVIQSLSQLDATYGPEVARTMVTNMACQVVYTPREQRDANEYSEMLGYTTLRRRTRTTSHGQSGSVSYAEVEERRALMLPQELKALSPEEEIIFVEGIAHPIKCSKIRYYKDGFFKARLKEKAQVPMLVLHEEEALPATAAATAAPVGTADAVQSRQQATASTVPPPSDMQEQDMINLGKWFRKRAGVSTPDDAEPSTGEMGVQAEERLRADAAAVIKVADVDVPDGQRKHGDPYGWHEFPEGKIRFTGLVRGADETGHDGFAVWLPGLPILYGEIARAFDENKHDFNLEILSFGWTGPTMLGMPMSALYFVSEKTALITQSLLIRFIEFIMTRTNRPFILKEYGKSHFLRKVFFQEGWVRLESNEEQNNV